MIPRSELSKTVIERIYKESLGIIISQAMRYPRTNLITFEDYIQVGSLAFLEALNQFDKNKNVKWSTYLTTCVSRALFQEYAKTRFKIKIPVQASKDSFIIKQMLLDGVPDAEIAKKLKIKQTTLDGIKNILLDFQYNRSNCQNQQEELSTVLTEFCDGVLSDEEKQIVNLKIDGLNFKEIGNSLNRSKEWARQTYKRAIRKLKREHGES